MFKSPENGLKAKLHPLGSPRCRSRGRKTGLLDIRIGQLMSIDILAREISITFLEPVTPQNPIDVTEGEISININRPREGRIGDFGRQNSPPGEEANNRNNQQSPWRPKRVPKRYINPSKARLMKLMELMGLIPSRASRSKQVLDPWRRPRLVRYGDRKSCPGPARKKPSISSSGSSGSKSCSRALKTGSKPSCARLGCLDVAPQFEKRGS